MESEQITIQKKELPELKKWLKSRNKNILEIIELEKESIKVIIKKD
jgi:hypothetical protein